MLTSGWPLPATTALSKYADLGRWTSEKYQPPKSINVQLPSGGHLSRYYNPFSNICIANHVPNESYTYFEDNCDRIPIAYKYVFSGQISEYNKTEGTAREYTLFFVNNLMSLRHRKLYKIAKASRAFWKRNDKSSAMLPSPVIKQPKQMNLSTRWINWPPIDKMCYPDPVLWHHFTL